MTETLQLNETVLHDAYTAAAKALQVRPEPVLRRSPDHTSAAARGISWWVLLRTHLIPAWEISQVSGYSQSNIRHAVSLVSVSVNRGEERLKDEAIAAVNQALKKHLQ